MVVRMIFTMFATCTDASYDDLDDFKISKSVSRKGKRKIVTKKSFKFSPDSADGKSMSSFEIKGDSKDNLEVSDTLIGCSSCGKLFEVVAIFQHQQLCAEKNLKVAMELSSSSAKGTCKEPAKTCPICKKLFEDYDDEKLNWHINKCLDQSDIDKSSLVAKSKFKENCQTNFFKAKELKAPKSRYEENLIIAKSLSASEAQIKKDDVKRQKILKKQPKIPKMLQCSPNTSLVTKQNIVEKFLMSKEQSDASEFCGTKLPPFKRIKCSRKRLALSLSHDIKELEEVSSLSFTCLKSLSDIDFVTNDTESTL